MLTIRARVSLHAATWRGRYSLSAAECEILKAAAMGVSRADIATLRGRSKLTVKRQIGTMLRKTGGHSLGELVGRFLRELLHDEPSREAPGDP